MIRMEHGQALPKVTSNPHQDPGDFVAEENKIEQAKPNYIGVFVILAILTATEIGITLLFPNHEGTASVGRVPILLFLTVAKAVLVILYYMHLKFDSRLYSFFFGVGVLAFALPFVIAMIFLLAPPTLTSARTEGGGDGGGQTRPTANPNAGPPVTFAVEGGEFFFAPDTFSPNNGQVVRVTLTNSGSVEHTFVLAGKPRSEDAEPWTTNDGKLVARAEPGASAKGNFTAPGPGDWVFYCNIPGHAVAGMHGVLSVK